MNDGAGSRDGAGKRLIRSGGPAATGAAFGVFMALAAPIAAQPVEPVPTIPAGVPAVLLPLQSAQPTAGGTWPGGSATERATLDLLDAELAFAFGEEEGARDWALPDAVEARLSRNPTLRIDPARLAYHGLLREPDDREQIYEPLHGQLRQIAALFDARIVILPLAAWYRLPSEEELAAATLAGRSEPPPGRAVLLTAIIDVRRSTVLWHGLIEGDPAPATSRESLTTLALRAAARLAPS